MRTTMHGRRCTLLFLPALLAAVATTLPLIVGAIEAPFSASTIIGGGWTLEAAYSGPLPSGPAAFGFQSPAVGQSTFALSSNFPNGGVVHFTARPSAAALELGQTSSISVQLANGEVVAGSQANQLPLPVGELREANTLAVRSGDERLYRGSVDARAPPPEGSGGQVGFGGSDGAGGQPESGTGSGTGQGGQGSGGGGTSGSSRGLVPCPDAPCTLNQLKDVAVNVWNWLVLTAGAAAVLAVVVAGVRYIVAVLQGADSSAIAEAKQSLTYAIIGTILLLTAVVIVNTIYNQIFGGQVPIPGLRPGSGGQR